MIARLLGFALLQRFVVLALAVLLTVGGWIACHRLPNETDPAVGDLEGTERTVYGPVGAAPGNKRPVSRGM